MRALTLVPLLVLTLATSVAAKTMAPISACGDVVPRGGLGYLTGNLDCSGYNNMAVVVLPGGSLELRGFTITGGIFGIGCYDIRQTPGGAPGYYSGGKCRIDGGGGSVAASEAHGIGGTRIMVANLTIDGAGQEGVSGDSKVRLHNVTITNCLGSGVAGGSVFAVDSTITGSGENGIAARAARLLGSIVTGNGVGPSCGGATYPQRCADLLTSTRPRLKSSQCGSSLAPIQQFPPVTWGVCSTD